MRDMIIGGIIVFAVGLLAPQTARSQGTLTYVSSLDQPSAGSEAVGSDSWQAAVVLTGNNAGGYALDSVQLEMTAASGVPNGFEVMLYAGNYDGPGAIYPGSSLGTLSGPGDPETSGIYTYTASSLTLSPDTEYFIVLTDQTAVANGNYAWSFANALPTESGGWGGSGYLLSSRDGISWSATQADPQFALTATAVPEPDALVLLGLTGLLFFASRHWQARSQPFIAR